MMFESHVNNDLKRTSRIPCMPGTGLCLLSMTYENNQNHNKLDNVNNDNDDNNNTNDAAAVTLITNMV